tara:strand:- start:1993 stop:2358 length:366 start_codon:yes stop_codon:yes gene_type:complete
MNVNYRIIDIVQIWVDQFKSLKFWFSLIPIPQKQNMSDPLIRTSENYVVLEPGKLEQILSEEETINWLIYWLKKLDKLPKDLKKYSSLKSAALRLIDTACDLNIKEGFTIQWFAIRLEPPN